MRLEPGLLWGTSPPERGSTSSRGLLSFQVAPFALQTPECKWGEPSAPENSHPTFYQTVLGVKVLSLKDPFKIREP